MSDREDTVIPTVGVPAFSRKPVTNRLIDLFAATQPGDLLTYEEMTVCAGCTRDAWKGTLGTVKKVLLDRYKIRLECETGVGYRHVSDDEIKGALSTKDIAGVGRAAQKAHKRIVSGVKDERNLPHAKVAQLQLAAHAASDRARKVLETSKAANGTLAIGDTLALLGKKLPA